MAATMTKTARPATSNGSSTTTGHRRTPSSTVSASKSKLSTSTASSDIEACLQILKKLAPPISAELPVLVTLPAVSSSNTAPPPLGRTGSQQPTLKRKLGDYTAARESGRKLSEQSAGEDSDSAKRQKRASTGQEDDVKASTSTASAPLKRGLPALQRSDSANSIASASNLAPKAGEAAKKADGHHAQNSLHKNPDDIGRSPSAPTATNSALESIALGTGWSKDRFRRLAAVCREKGRALKHSGDQRMREYQPSSSNRHIPVLSLLEQVDAIVLYAYAFFCEDQAIGSIRNRQPSTSSSSLPTSSTSGHHHPQADKENAGAGPISWKSGCKAENWKSIFGLMVHVKGRAEKMGMSPPSSRSSPRLANEIPRAMELVTAWLSMLEALILQHLTTNTSRHLNVQASRLLSSNGPSPPEGDNESVGGQSSTSGNSSGSTTHAPDTFLQNYMKLQADLEKIHALWPSSQSVLLKSDFSRSNGHSPSSSSADEDVLSRVLRKGKMAYETEPTKLEDLVVPSLPKQDDESTKNGPNSPEDLFKDEENYFSFAWPMVLHGQNTVAHATSFGRALLSEIADRLEVGYTPQRLE